MNWADKYNFTQRQVLIFCLKFVKKDMIHFVPEAIPDYLTPEIIQDLIDELGGNVELNRKKYLEEQNK